MGCRLWGRSDSAAATAGLTHAAAWQKPTQYCKATLLQLRENKRIFEKDR